MVKYDFSGWATRNDLVCSDGRVIRQDAFKINDGQQVPLVWNHGHASIDNVIGHAFLQNRPEGVYAYGVVNEDVPNGKIAKSLIKHNDINALSIYANQLKQNGRDVLHGNIREVSIVIGGANPGAFIDDVVSHSDSVSGEAVIVTGYAPNLEHGEIEFESIEDEGETLAHADEKDVEVESKSADTKQDSDDEMVQDVIDSMTEKQRNVMYALIGQALDESNDEDNDEGEEDMKHNVFADGNEQIDDNVISHSDMVAAINDTKRYGSMRDSFIAHGIDDVEYLFPEAKSLNTPPEFIKRNIDWVDKVMSGVHHTPFSRIKSMFADITEDEARARGYIKGKLKKEEVFGLLKRTTTPTTVYKKQKMDRDDVIDITDFDVIAWLKGEMRMMLDEELARAFLFGDGRLASSDDKINEMNIRPAWLDEELYTIHTAFTPVTTGAQQDQDDANARAFIRTAIKSRKNYKGSGNPIMFINEDMLTNCLLLEDKMGRVIYDTEEKLRTTLRVSQLVPVELMEDLTRTDKDGDKFKLEALYLNLNDYNVGADKGGAVSMFDDFDIDYNQQKYLIETRCSGALIKPFSAVAIESTVAATAGGDDDDEKTPGTGE